MHKSRLGAMVVDCETDDLFKQAGFWSGALGLSPESQDGQKNDKYVRLEGHADDPQVLLQKVDHPSRMHIDIETDDIEAEVSRLESLGATIVDRLEKWTVMEAPSGHRFCVISPVRVDFRDNANAWP